MLWNPLGLKQASAETVRVRHLPAALKHYVSGNMFAKRTCSKNVLNKSEKINTSFNWLPIAYFERRSNRLRLTKYTSLPIFLEVSTPILSGSRKYFAQVWRAPKPAVRETRRPCPSATPWKKPGPLNASTRGYPWQPFIRFAPRNLGLQAGD